MVNTYFNLSERVGGPSGSKFTPRTERGGSLEAAAYGRVPAVQIREIKVAPQSMRGVNWLSITVNLLVFDESLRP